VSPNAVARFFSVRLATYSAGNLTAAQSKARALQARRYPARLYRHGDDIMLYVGTYDTSETAAEVAGKLGKIDLDGDGRADWPQASVGMIRLPK